MRRWMSLDTDRGAVLWGILCCWLVGLGNIGLLGLGVTIFYVVPIDLFVVPLLVTFIQLTAQQRLR